MDYLAKFLEHAPAPNQPMGLDFQWPDVEWHLKCRLPDDFKQLVTFYGSGVFLPSSLQFCNYLDGRKIQSDHWFDAMKISYRFESATPYPMHPEPGGLLPFAGVFDEYRFFWNPRPTPWSIVSFFRDGQDIEEIHGVETAEFLFKFLARSFGDDENIKEHVSRSGLVPEPQQFQPTIPKPRIESEVCERIAWGGELASYRLLGRIRAQLPIDLKLVQAQRDVEVPGNTEITWEWKAPLSQVIAAPDCSFHLLVPRSQSADALHEHRDQLANDYFSKRSEVVTGELIEGGRNIYWVRATEGFMGEAPTGYEVVFLGDHEEISWELWVHVIANELETFFSFAEDFVRSMQIDISTHG